MQEFVVWKSKLLMRYRCHDTCEDGTATQIAPCRLPLCQGYECDNSSTLVDTNTAFAEELLRGRDVLA